MNPILGGSWGVAGSQPMSTAVHRSPTKLWISSSIFNLRYSPSSYIDAVCNVPTNILRQRSFRSFRLFRLPGRSIFPVVRAFWLFRHSSYYWFFSVKTSILQCSRTGNRKWIPNFAIFTTLINLINKLQLPFNMTIGS